MRANRSFWLFALFSLAVGAVPLEARGASKSVWIETHGECPARGEVEDALPVLLRNHSLAEVAEREGAVEATVIDRGESYEVRVLGLSRRIPDRSRDCVKRAQSAAVVIALALEPLSQTEDDLEVEMPTSVGSRARAETPVDSMSTPPRVERPVSQSETAILVGLGLAVTSSPDDYGPTVGPRLGFVARRGSFAGALTGAVFPAQRIAGVGESPVSLMRYPLDLGVSYGLSLASVEATLALGCAFDILVVGLANEPSHSRLDVGPKAALGLTYRGGTVEPFAEIDARWFPYDYKLVLRPEGEVGHTPRFYLGLTLGLRLGLL